MIPALQALASAQRQVAALEQENAALRTLVRRLQDERDADARRALEPAQVGP